PCGDPMICPDRQVIKGSSVSCLVEAKLKEIREENATGNATGQEAGWFLVFSEYLTGLRTLNVYFASHDLANVSKSAVDKQAAEQWKEKARKYFNESKKYHDSLEDLNSRFLRLEIELKSLEGN
ncbi:MAG: hypothetical protein OI715_00430, partial (plasmid) [Candidatus Methanoperedens sp.]